MNTPLRRIVEHEVRDVWTALLLPVAFAFANLNVRANHGLPEYLSSTLLKML